MSIDINEVNRIEQALRYCACNDECTDCPFKPLYNDCYVEDLKMTAANIIAQLRSEIIK